MTIFYLTRTESTLYALTRDDVERLLSYEVGEADGKSDAELAAEMKRELDGDHGFEIVGDLQFIDGDAEVVADDYQVEVAR